MWATAWVEGREGQPAFQQAEAREGREGVDQRQGMGGVGCPLAPRSVQALAEQNPPGQG